MQIRSLWVKKNEKMSRSTKSVFLEGRPLGQLHQENGESKDDGEQYIGVSVDVWRTVLWHARQEETVAQVASAALLACLI